MSVYASGLAAIGATAPRGAQVGQEGFGVFVTPGQIDAKVRELDASFGSMHQAILSFTPPTDRAVEWKQWHDAWVGFRAGWEGFVNQLKDDTLTRLAGSTAEMLLHYQERLAAWQDDFRRTWGAHAPGPAVQPPKKDDNTLRTIGIGVAVAVTAGVVLWALRKVLP